MSCLSVLVLDRIRVGEFVANGQEHLTRCQRCRTRLADLKSDAVRFREAGSMEQDIDSILRASVRRRRNWLQPSAMAVMAAAAMVAFFAVRNEHAVAPTTRSKGGFALDLIVQHLDGKIEAVLPEQPLAPNESIRFQVSMPHTGHLAIVGIDSAAQITAYQSSSQVQAGDKQVLPGSIVLDATLGSERVFALLCDHPVSDAELMQAGRSALAQHASPRDIKTLELDCAQTSVLFDKVAHR